MRYKPKFILPRSSAKFICRKEIEILLLPLNQNGNQVWCLNRVTELPKEIINIATRLSGLNFLTFIRIGDIELYASDEVYGARDGTPLVKEGHPTANGIIISFHRKYKSIQFGSINSPIKGNDSKMVDAVLTKLPKSWKATMYKDWSNSFWEKMVGKHANLKWML